MIYAAAEAHDRQNMRALQSSLFALKNSVVKDSPIYHFTDLAIRSIEQGRDVAPQIRNMIESTKAMKGSGPVAEAVAGAVEGVGNSVGNIVGAIGDTVNKAKLTDLQRDLQSDQIELAKLKAEYYKMVKQPKEFLKQLEHDRYWDFEHFYVPELRLSNFGFKNKESSAAPRYGTDEAKWLKNADMALAKYFKEHKAELKDSIKEIEGAVHEKKKEILTLQSQLNREEKEQAHEHSLREQENAAKLSGRGPKLTRMTNDYYIRMAYPNAEIF
jgi:hypothetical protein